MKTMYIFIFIPILRLFSYLCKSFLNHYDIEFGSNNYDKKKIHIIPKFCFYTIFAIPPILHTFIQAIFYDKGRYFTWGMYVVNISLSSILFDRFKDQIIYDNDTLNFSFLRIKNIQKRFSNKKILFYVIFYIVLHINILLNLNEIWYISIVLYSMLYTVIDYSNTVLYLPCKTIDQNIKNKLLVYKKTTYVSIVIIQMNIILKGMQLFDYQINIYAVFSYFLLPISILYDPIFKDLFCKKTNHIF